MTHKPTMKPILKWAGGKRQLLPVLRRYIPQDVREGKVSYLEIFVGGGALVFDLAPEQAVINDLNEELINLYTVVRDSPSELIDELNAYPNNADFYYDIRQLDRNREIYQSLTKIKRAARMVYLNRTGYNGLYRVNRAGQFNVPFGKYKNPRIIDAENIQEISSYLNKPSIRILNLNYRDAAKYAHPGDFIYLDPPYDPLSESANFTSYQATGFDKDEQVRLKETCDRLTKKGVRFLLSNSSTDFIRDLYRDYTLDTVSATRAINSNASKRGPIQEVLVRNYE